MAADVNLYTETDAFTPEPTLNFATPDTDLNSLLDAQTSLGASPTTALLNSISSVPASAASSTNWASLIAPISNGLASITSSIARVINPAPGQAGYYNAAGQFVPIVAPTTPAIGGTSLATVGANLSSTVSSFLPILFIGVVLWFFVSIFSGKKR